VKVSRLGFQFIRGGSGGGTPTTSPTVEGWGWRETGGGRWRDGRWAGPERVEPWRKHYEDDEGQDHAITLSHYWSRDRVTHS
jgi:hypothetical protein